MRAYTSKAGRSFPFTLDDVEFTTSGSVPLLELAELSRLANADAESPEGLAALINFFEAALSTGEYARFRRHCREHRTDAETLLSILGDLTEDMSDIPTRRPSPSAPGPTATGSTYKVVSSSGTVTSLPLTPQRQVELAEAVRRATG